MFLSSRTDRCRGPANTGAGQLSPYPVTRIAVPGRMLSGRRVSAYRSRRADRSRKAALQRDGDSGMSEFGDTVDRRDIDRFAAQAPSWWDPGAAFGRSTSSTRVRLDFIRGELLAHFGRDPARRLRPFAGLRLADIGCGGGLIAEPMARLGFAVTGIDAGAEAIDVARAHAAASGLAIDYRVADVETLAARRRALRCRAGARNRRARRRPRAFSRGARARWSSRAACCRRDAEPHGAILCAGDCRRRIRAAAGCRAAPMTGAAFVRPSEFVLGAAPPRLCGRPARRAQLRAAGATPGR